MTQHQRAVFHSSGLRVLAVALIGMLSVFIVSEEPRKAAATAMSTTQSCSKPSLTHSIVLFGDGGSNTEYVSSNHTFGSAGDMYGLAIDGSAQFPNYSTSFTSSGMTNYITGGYSGMRPTANGGSWATSGFPYNQQEWIDYADALADAAEADQRHIRMCAFTVSMVARCRSRMTGLITQMLLCSRCMLELVVARCGPRRCKTTKPTVQSLLRRRLST